MCMFLGLHGRECVCVSMRETIVTLSPNRLVFSLSLSISQQQ